MSVFPVNPSRGEIDAQMQQRALAAASCGITIADARQPDMPLLYVNDAFCAITGYSAAEVLGRNCRFLQGEERDQAGLTTLRAAIRAGQSCRVTLRNYRKDGTLFWNELYMAAVHNAAGELTHFVGVQADITARVQAEEALIREREQLELALYELGETQSMLVHAEKMNALGQMVAALAHEINNPIAFVISNLHSLRAGMDGLLAAYADLEARWTEAGSSGMGATLASIRQHHDVDYLRADLPELVSASLDGLERVKKLILALRTFARLDEATAKAASVRDCVESALMIARSLFGDRVSVQMDFEELPLIRCYPAELNQVFLNLMINAAQAIPEGQPGWIRIIGRDIGPAIEITVADSGMGIRPEVLPRLFTPFFTTKPPGVGVGLGLAICYRIIVERHQGTLTAASPEGAGAVFTITLPKDTMP